MADPQRPSLANGKRLNAERVSEGVDLAERHAIVTGANTGIGLETARVLALRGATVTMACRNLEKGQAARQGLVEASGGGIDAESLHLMKLDLASLQSVRDFAGSFLDTGRPISLLINNAGIMISERRETSDGFEAHFGVNHLGHFLLTNLLEERIRKSAPARIINVASDAMHFHGLSPALEDLDWKERRFSGLRAYGSSKLMNLLFSKQIARAWSGSGVVSHALHPGIVKTELGRDQAWIMSIVGLFMLPFMKDVGRGAATSVFAATFPECERQNGLYFSDCSPAREPKLAADESLQQALWDRSAELAGL